MPRLRPTGRRSLVRSHAAPAPLSFAQQRLWFLEQLEPASALYNIHAAFRIQGALDHAALQRALDTIVARHEALRTTFAAPDGHPVQGIAAPRPVSLVMRDLAGHPADDREATCQRLLAAEVQRPFDLTRDLLLRAMLVRLGEDEHVLLVVLHHIASDGWSMGVFWRELGLLYAAAAEGRPADLPDLPIQYADYAVWQRQGLQGDVLAAQLAYWRRQLAEAPPGLELPTDRPRPAVQTFRGAHRTHTLPPPLHAALEALSRAAGVTLFMTLLAAFQTLLARYTGQEDIIVGSPIAGRTRVETEGLIGFFVNTLALRTDLTGNPPFRTLLTRVRDVCLDAYAHQEVPFEKLVEELKPERTLSQSPLFQVMFALQNAPRTTLALPGLALTPLRVESGTAKFDLTVFVTATDAGLQTLVEYNTDLFDAATIDRLLGHFQTLLEGVVAAPERPVGDLPLLTAAERHQLLVAWNATATAYPRDACIHTLFEAQVARTPEAVAVVCADQALTYRELNRRANQLAHYLRALGVGPDALVGICLERSLEMVVGLLGILKAGGRTCRSIRPTPRSGWPSCWRTPRSRCSSPSRPCSRACPRPPSRRSAWTRTGATLAAEPREPARRRPRPRPSPTSSTPRGPRGSPRGWRCRIGRWSASSSTRITSHSRPRISSPRRPTPLSTPRRSRSGARFCTELRSLSCRKGMCCRLRTSRRSWHSTESATLFVTTALFNQCARQAPAAFRCLRTLLFGGETSDPQWVAAVLRHAPPRRLLHVYGPTETTTFATWFEVRRCRRTLGRSPSAAPSPTRRSTCSIGSSSRSPSGCRASCTSAGRAWRGATSTAPS